MSWPALTDHLATLTEQDILEYYECFEKMHGALYRRDLWAAAYLIGGGCSDDNFIDFGPDSSCRDTSRVRCVSAAERR